MNVHEDLAQSKLLYTHLNGTLRVLSLCKLVETSVLLLYKKNCKLDVCKGHTKFSTDLVVDFFIVICAHDVAALATVHIAVVNFILRGSLLVVLVFILFIHLLLLLILPLHVILLFFIFFHFVLLSFLVS